MSKPTTGAAPALLRKACRFDVKALSDEGVFEGYASTFDLDSDGDRIMPGAFTRTLAAHVAKGRRIPILWQHDTREPIGYTLEAAEDANGLKVKGQILTNLRRGREAYELARAEVLGGLSIGFSIPKDGATWDEESGHRLISEVRLYEYSLVTFPANEAATLTGVKANDALTAALLDLRDEVRALKSVIRAPSAGAVIDERVPDLSDALTEARSILASLKS